MATTLLDSIRPHLKEAWGLKTDIRLIRELAGRSGAGVWEVDLISATYNGLAILKVGEAPSEIQAEASNLARAHQEAPEFAVNHLPRLLHAWTNETSGALLSSIAGDALTHVQPLGVLKSDQQVLGTRRLFRGVLHEWNANASIREKDVTERQLLTEWLGTRANAEGPLAHFVGQSWSKSPFDGSVQVQGMSLPNPFAFANTPALWTSPRSLRPISGFSHNDMHAFNALIHIRPAPLNDSLDYHIIDLSHYHSEVPLLYDHAYFEVSHLVDNRSQSSVHAWVELLSLLVEDHFDVSLVKASIDDLGMMGVLSACRDEIRQWVHTSHRSHTESLEQQALLARVAAGLRFAARAALDSRKRTMALLYAAFHLRHYFDLFDIPWEKGGRKWLFEDEVREPPEDGWRDLWKAAREFSSGNNYLFIGGAGLRQVAKTELKALGQVTWSAVVDLDPETRAGGLLEAIHGEVVKKRAVRVDLDADIDYRAATRWFLAAGDPGDQLLDAANYSFWRRGILPPIRDELYRAAEVLKPKPFIVLILGEGIPNRILNALLETVDEVFKDRCSIVFVSDHVPGSVRHHSLTHIRSSTRDAIAGLWQIFGHAAPVSIARVPARVDGTGERRMTGLELEELRYLEEDLEIVHAGLATSVPDGRRLAEDFWRGHGIIWAELDMNADVRRELLEPLKREVQVRIEEGKGHTLRLAHSAGAGATTLARRIAWDLKDFYPTVVVKRVSRHTAGRIETLYHKTRLPILLIVESAFVPEPNREDLARELESRLIRGVLMIYVVRVQNPTSILALRDPMSSSEAERFLRIYSERATGDQVLALKALAHDIEMIRYRCPFFFGLFAYETEYAHVRDYVDAYSRTESQISKELLKLLALVSRFSQSWLPQIAMQHAAHIDASKSTYLEELIGDGPVQLVLSRDGSCRFVHPLIAEEVLKQYAAVPGASNDKWESTLVPVSIKLIETLSAMDDIPYDAVIDILFQLFIRREPWSDQAETRRNFSELVRTLPSKEGQHQVLRQLTVSFPEEAHFWNHLGRHHMYILQSAHQEAEHCLMKAIELDSGNHIHFHSLGMVYRFAAKRRLDSLRAQKASIEQSLASIAALVIKGEECFEESRRRDPENDHGYVTHIQMLCETITGLFLLSGSATYEEFIGVDSSEGDWVRERLSVAEDLLAGLKRQHPYERASTMIDKCESSISEVYGDLQGVIETLSGMLARREVHRPSVRRSIAHAIIRSHRHAWHHLSDDTRRYIRQLMDDNLLEAPAEGRDVMIWFNAVRRLPEFDVFGAIDIFARWGTHEEAALPYYYQYVLRFVNWRYGAISDRRSILEAMQRCESAAGRLLRIRSAEWLADGPKTCPIVHESELGGWDFAAGFHRETGGLAFVDGSIAKIHGPQAGKIEIRSLAKGPEFGTLEVFFVPGVEFVAPRDLGQPVSFNLGFSFVGLRGWRVQAKKVDR